MSLKETLGLRTHKEDPKMFWFELTLLCLILAAVSWLLSLLKLSGVPGILFRVAPPLFLSWALVCALFTELVNHRRHTSAPYSQHQLENYLLLLAAVLALLDQILHLLPNAESTFPVVFAGVGAYFMARVSGPRLRSKEKMTTQELILVLISGVMAWLILLPFLDMAYNVISAL